MSPRDAKALAHDRLADQFDALMNDYDLTRRLETLLDDFMRDDTWSGKIVLDAGCGTGRGTQAIRKRGATVVAMDIGLNLVRRTVERCNCAAVVGDILACPFPDSYFDVVFSTEVIEHTPDPLAAVAQFYRVLKPGGHLVLSTPNRAWHWLVSLASKLKLRPYEGFENFVSPQELRRTAERLGLTVITHTGLHLAPFQIRVLHPVLRQMDRWGERLLPVMINQCMHAVKNNR